MARICTLVSRWIQERDILKWRRASRPLWVHTLGQDTEEILHDLQFRAAQRNELKERHIVTGPDGQ